MKANQQQIYEMVEKYKEKNKKLTLYPEDIILLRDEIIESINIDPEFTSIYIEQNDLNNQSSIKDCSAQFLYQLIQQLLVEYMMNQEVKEKNKGRRVKRNRSSSFHGEQFQNQLGSMNAIQEQQQGEQGQSQSLDEEELQPFDPEDPDAHDKMLNYYQNHPSGLESALYGENGKNIEEKVQKKEWRDIPVNKLTDLPPLQQNSKFYEGNHKKLDQYMMKFRLHVREAFNNHASTDDSQPNKLKIFTIDLFSFLRQAFENDNFLFLDDQSANIDFFSKTSSFEFLTQLLKRFFKQVRKYDMEILNIRTLSFQDILDLLEFWLRIDQNLYIRYGSDIATNFKKNIPSSYQNPDENNKSQDHQNAIKFSNLSLLKQIASQMGNRVSNHNLGNSEAVENQGSQQENLNLKINQILASVQKPQDQRNLQIESKQQLLHSLQDTIANYQDMLQFSVDATEQKVIRTTIETLQNQINQLRYEIAADPTQVLERKLESKIQNKSNHNNMNNSHTTQPKQLKGSNADQIEVVVEEDQTSDVESLGVNHDENSKQQLKEEKRKINLKEIYTHYCQKQALAAGNEKVTFDQILNENSVLNINKFMQFCKDFGILQYSKELQKSKLLEVFQKSGNFFQEMNFDGFLITHEKISEIMFQDQPLADTLAKKLDLFYQFIEVDDTNSYRKQLGIDLLQFHIVEQRKKPNAQSSVSAENIQQQFYLQQRKIKKSKEDLAAQEERNQLQQLIDNRKVKQRKQRENEQVSMVEYSNNNGENRQMTKNQTDGYANFAPSMSPQQKQPFKIERNFDRPEKYNELKQMKNYGVFNQNQITWDQLQNITFQDLAGQFGDQDDLFRPSDLYDQRTDKQDLIYLAEYEKQKNVFQMREQQNLIEQIDNYGREIQRIPRQQNRYYNTNNNNNKSNNQNNNNNINHTVQFIDNQNSISHYPTVMQENTTGSSNNSVKVVRYMVTKQNSVEEQEIQDNQKRKLPKSQENYNHVNSTPQLPSQIVKQTINGKQNQKSASPSNRGEFDLDGERNRNSQVQSHKMPRTSGSKGETEKSKNNERNNFSNHIDSRIMKRNENSGGPSSPRTLNDQVQAYNAPPPIKGGENNNGQVSEQEGPQINHSYLDKLSRRDNSPQEYSQNVQDRAYNLEMKEQSLEREIYNSMNEGQKPKVRSVMQQY